MPQSLRIAILGSRGYPSTYGGFETLVRRLAPYLRDQGHQVLVYGRSTRPNAGQHFIDGIQSLNTRGLDTKNFSTLSYGLTATLDAALRKPDVILVLNVANGLFLPIIRACRIPTVLNVDGIEWERGKWGKIAKATFRYGARSSARWSSELIADSLAIQTYWKTNFNRTCEYIPYGADEIRSNPTLVQRMGLKPGAYLLVVARMVPENNIRLILDACQILGTTSDNAIFVGSATYSSAIMRAVESMAARGHIRATGHMPDQDVLHALWSSAGVYVHGHSVGGTNPALLQALGSGAPTLAFRTEFNAEVLRHEDQLFNASSQQLATKIAAVLNSVPLQQCYRERGIKIIRDRYQWEVILKKYNDIICDVARSRR